MPLALIIPVPFGVAYRLFHKTASTRLESQTENLLIGVTTVLFSTEYCGYELALMSRCFRASSKDETGMHYCVNVRQL